MGMAVLIKDRLESETDSIQEDWADPETLSALLTEIPFDDGQLTISIVDEMGKIQVNSLVTFPEGRQFNMPQLKIWERLALGFTALQEENESPDEAEEIDPLAIINSLKDWLDSGDDDAITGLSGAETDYYEALDPPYACKNGPFDHLSEVRLVKGISPELFDGIGGSGGLSAYLTVYGAEKKGDQQFTYPGQVNINTADLAVLSALLPIESADFATVLVEHRIAVSGSQYTNDLTQANWYKNVPGFGGENIDDSVITMVSNIFQITATAQLDEVKATTTAVVRREQDSKTGRWKCKLLNWKAQ
jgi:general secretion pathway protein K